MIVYLDVIFFINLLYQLGILKVLAVLYKIEISIMRLIGGAALGSLLYCICIVVQIPTESMWVKIVTGTVIGMIVNLTVFRPLAYQRPVTLLITQYFLDFCLSGFLQFLPQEASTGYLMASASGAVIFLCLFCIKIRKIIFERLKENQSIYHVYIQHRGKFLGADALLDTGNGLTDPISGENVIIMQSSTAKKLFAMDEMSRQPGYRMIPYHSIGKEAGILEAFRLERLEVIDTEHDKENRKVFLNTICAVYQNDYRNAAYEVILHPLMF